MSISSCSSSIRSGALLWLICATGTAIAGASAGLAQDRPGRFVMSPVDGGFARLDTETGAMSLCKAQPQDAASPSGWACQPMGDTTADAQAKTRKLEAENKDLRAEVKRMEDLLGLNGEKPKAEDKQAEQRPGGPGGGLNLPSEQDVDRALSYLERMVKKFHDTMKRLEDGSGRKGTTL
jgi:hypothetical protein